MEIDFERKSFWERKEGKVAMIGNALFAAGVLVGAATHLPDLATFVINTPAVLGVTVAMVGTAGLFGVSAKARQLARLLYFSGWYNVAKFLVEIDPLAAVYHRIEEKKDQLKNIIYQVASVKAQLEGLRKDVEEQKRGAERERRNADQAERDGRDDIVMLSVRQAKRLDDDVVEYTALFKRMVEVYQRLILCQRQADFEIKDTQYELEGAVKKGRITQSASSAMHSAVQILQNGGDAMDSLYDAALDKIVEVGERRLAEMDVVFEQMESLTAGIDVKNGLYREEAYRELEKWRQGKATREDAVSSHESDKEDILAIDLGNPFKTLGSNERQNHEDSEDDSGDYQPRNRGRVSQ